MAYIHKGPAKNAAYFYNVEQPVGMNSVNASGDVKLVQYLLRNIYGNAAAALAVDGFIGPVTVSWIDRFQKEAKAAGAAILNDSRVDRAFGEVSTVSKTTYTILLMNDRLRGVNPAAYAQLPAQVPLNPKPKASPYNPRVVEYLITRSGGEYTIILTYDTGKTEHLIAQVGNDSLALGGYEVLKDPDALDVRAKRVGDKLHFTTTYRDGSTKTVIVNA